VVDDQTELRKILFEGQFKDLRTNTAIAFSADGKINGLDKETYFELAYDFGEGFFYDVGIFYPNKHSSGTWTRGELFHFKINTDTVKLFKIKPDWEGLEHKIGGIKYVLVKS
jgi:hypothetical protein